MMLRSNSANMPVNVRINRLVIAGGARAILRSSTRSGTFWAGTLTQQP